MEQVVVTPKISRPPKSHLLACPFLLPKTSVLAWCSQLQLGHFMVSSAAGDWVEFDEVMVFIVFVVVTQ